MKHHILMTGGGTMGSVSPLFAVVPELQRQGHRVTWVGTYHGPEGSFVRSGKLPFFPMVTAKLPRYLTWKLLLFPFAFVAALFQALVLIVRLRPTRIVSAGGFTSVPLVWVGALFRIPSIIHQQDLQPGLANKLMAPVATRITVSFEPSLQVFPEQKTTWIGNPVRDLTPTTTTLTLDPSVPTVLIMGGGTGAQAVNELVTAALCDFANVIHLKGEGRDGAMQSITHKRYHPFPFLNTEYAEALHAATVVVARAGIGTITELAALQKPAIIIPMPNTHQEENVEYFAKHHAILPADQRTLTPATFTTMVRELLNDTAEQQELQEAIQHILPANANTQFINTIVHE